MFELADKFGNSEKKAEHLKAAQLFRLPYWDPWMPRNVADASRNWDGLFGVPAILRAQEVFVRRPGSYKSLTRIDNPLYRYKVPKPAETDKKAQVPWDKLPAQVVRRDPVDQESTG